MPELRFFIGKGGVGKTTASAAYAVHSAAHHPKRSVLLISTDPAHSLADIFETELGDEPQRVSLPHARLFAWQINAQKQFDKFLRRNRKDILDLVESGTMFTRGEISPLLDTTLPGMAEVSALLALEELLGSGGYDEIVVDTAPMGHTLRLFEMPEHFARFLVFLETAGSRDRVLAQHFGGGKIAARPFLSEWQDMVASVQDALSARNALVVLVTSPEVFSLNEAVRAAQQLRDNTRLKINAVVLNRAVSQPGSCRVCRQRAGATHHALQFLEQHFRGALLSVGEDAGAPIVGVAALRAFGNHVYAGERLRVPSSRPGVKEVELKKTEWPELQTPLSLTIGKGGVGKTTVSAALAFHERRRHPGRRVTICSSDPAPSLADVFQKRVGDPGVSVLGDKKFTAIELDSAGEFHGWADQIKNKVDRALTSEVRGVHLDMSFDRQIFLALLDVVPPGVDEIFAVFRMMELLRERTAVVIDMAPTGHALELLAMPDRLLLWSRLLLKSLAAHRTLPLAQDAAVEIATVAQRVRELATTLKDRKRAQVWPVMLPEPLPDRETGRLLRAMQALQTSSPALFVNRVIFSEDAARCPRCTRARAWQLRTLERLRKVHRDREIYVARNFPYEIAGARALDAFTKQLWRLK
jgi:arsenite/tail-anchored protein-transporting ATPase